MAEYGVTIVPFVPEHMEFCDFLPEYRDQAAREDPAMLAMSREAWTMIDSDGAVVGCIGVMDTHAGCGFVWAFASCSTLRHMGRIARFTRNWIATLDLVRIECTVLKNYRPGHRMARLLGFRRETTRPMKLWDGVNDFHLYAIVRDS